MATYQASRVVLTIDHFATGAPRVSLIGNLFGWIGEDAGR